MQILDARGIQRFYGKVPEPREGVRSGHIASSINLPFGLLVNPNGTVKETPVLETIFRGVGVDLTKKETINSCGSGVTACILDLGLTLCGAGSSAPKSCIYDGSWSEYGTVEEPEFK